MRTSPLPFLFAALLSGAALPLAAEATRTLRVEVAPGPFAVENLAGRMTVRAGSGDRTVVVATVHAETEALAAGFRLETSNRTGSGATVRVRYPEGENTIRYRSSRVSDDDSFLLGLFASSFQGRFSYDGRAMRVSSVRGKLAYADVEVEVPALNIEAAFRNRVGAVSAAGISGRLTFDVASADVRLDRLDGDIRLTGSSGDILAADIHGSWKSDFSSGDVVLERFSGDRADFHSSSGDVRIGAIEAESLSLDTSSGDLKITDAEIGEVSLHTGSGDISIEARGSRLGRLRARTGSGDIRVRLPREASFDARASLGSGDMHVGFTDGTATLRKGDLVAYRRGDGATNIDVEAGSGNLTIDPR